MGYTRCGCKVCRARGGCDADEMDGAVCGPCAHGCHGEPGCGRPGCEWCAPSRLDAPAPEEAK